MAIGVDISRDKIAAFCRRNNIRSLAFFGSVLRDDFGPDSDVDVLVEFEHEHKHSLIDIVRMEAELTEMFGRKAELVERQAVERSANYIRRRHVLESVKENTKDFV
ncbi:MAG TPA: nucleotidyltransferase [Planctomycetes bacterium]|nr:nucleotidyltransferase [Planctomycetota bacterium]HIJ70318.1 nucleotidyltransferase [Planctomycetota bacterium]